MYQRESKYHLKNMKVILAFLLALALLLPSLPDLVQAADTYEKKLSVTYINQKNYTSSFTGPDGKVVKNAEGQVATVKISGCGAASSAMVIGYYQNKSINPETIFQWAVDNGLYKGKGLNYDALEKINNSYDVYLRWSASYNEMVNTIKDNRPVIAYMEGKGNMTFTTQGHYIVLIGYKKDSKGNEYFLVNDPNHPEHCGKYFPKNTITGELGSSGYGITAYKKASSLTVRPSMDTTTLKPKNGCNITGYVASNAKLTDVTGQILNSSGSVVQTKSQNPGATFFDLKTSKINENLTFGSLSEGSYKLKITATDANKKTTSSTISFTVGNGGSTAASTLAITSLSPSNVSIQKGKSYNISGTVSSNYTITAVKGEFINSSGKVVQTATVKPNSKSLDLKSSDINMNLAFGKLDPGNYTLKITATDSKKTVSSGKSFTITPAPSKLTGTVSMATTTIKKGNGCNILGSFSSGSKITNVTGKILNSSGTALQTQSISPNTTSVDLKSSKINQNLKFGTLAKGSYKLQVTAKDSAGNTLTKTISFTVN